MPKLVGERPHGRGAQESLQHFQNEGQPLEQRLGQASSSQLASRRYIPSILSKLGPQYQIHNARLMSGDVTFVLLLNLT